MLVYRSTKRAGGVPPWLEGVAAVGDKTLRHSERTDGHLVCLRESWRELPPADADWRDAGDGWEAVCWGDWDIHCHLREQWRLKLAPVWDGEGREWAAPAVLHTYPLDGVSFDVPLGADWQPDPTPDQARLIGAARWARESILAGLDLDEDQDLFEAEVPITLDQTTAARAVSDLLCTVYHVSPGVLQACRLVDRSLILGVLQTAAGLNSSVLRRVAEGA